MMGQRLSDGSYTGTICKIMSKGGLKVKVMVASEEQDQEAKDLLGNKVLGYDWEATSDNMGVKFAVNISGRIRKLKKKPDLTPDSLHLLSGVKLTKRLALVSPMGSLTFLASAVPLL